MVELKQLTIGNLNALGITVNLPRGGLRLIVRNHVVVCDDSIDLERIVKKYPQLCIIQVCDCETIDAMLEETIVYCSSEAIKLGVYKGMRVRDVFTLL